jgi:hypothetical protein
MLRSAAPVLGAAAVVAARRPDGSMAPMAAGAPDDRGLERKPLGSGYSHGT